MTRVLGAVLLVTATTALGGEAPESLQSDQMTPQATTNQFGVLRAAGILTDFVATRDTDGFDRNSTRAVAAVKFESIYDFASIGASTDNFKQGEWSLRANSIVGIIRKVDPGTAEGVFARLGATANTYRTVWHGEGTWNKRLNERTGFELVAGRDAVESRPAFERGILANILGISFDYAPTDRLTLIGMPTYRRFSDGNEQTGIRGWGIYTLVPEQGLSLMVHARAYESSQNGGGAYFSPGRYDRAVAGLRLRRSFGDWRVFAIAEAGREWIDHDVEKPTNQVSLTATRSFEKSASVGVQLARFQATGEGAVNLAATERYVWKMGRVYIAIPFQ